MKTIEVWSDGSCSIQDRIGGWGTVVIIDGIEIEVFGSSLDTTSNRMELTAAMKGLRLIKTPARIEVYTDSKYVRDGILKNGWGCGDTVKNNDLWKPMMKLVNHHLTVKPIWVPGHSNVEYNERADMLAGNARKKRVARVAPQYRCKYCEYDFTKQQMTQLVKYAQGIECVKCHKRVGHIRDVNREVRV